MSVSHIQKAPSDTAAVATIGCEVNRSLLRISAHAGMLNESLANQATLQCKEMTEIQALMTKIEATTDKTSSYSVSIPLLGAAYMNDRLTYKKWESGIFQAFGINPESSVEEIVEKLKGKASENAWILGRLLVANLKMGDKASAEKIASVIEKLLEVSPVDPFSAWAYGYLAIFYAQVKPEEYPALKAKMIETTEALIAQPEQKGKDNVHWSIVMELQSLADMGERKTFDARIQALLEFTGTASVVDALETIPPGDFRAWAASLILSAAKKVKDEALVSALTEYLPKTIESSPSDGDKMLARLIRIS